MSKSILFGFGIVFASIIIVAGYLTIMYKQAQGGQPTPTPSVTPSTTLLITSTAQITATPTISVTTGPDKTDADVLKAALLFKTGIPAPKFEFSISSNNGVIAKGSVRNTDDMGGAMWAAGKKNGTWIVSYVGQGVPLCTELTGFSYPIAWFSHCLDAKGNTVAR